MENLNKITEITKVIVHSGVFHSDDVCCVSLLKALGYNGIIERKNKITDEEMNNPSVLVIDVGRRHDPEKGLFDHHQIPSEEGIAAFGLLSQWLGVDDDFYKSFVNPVCRQDVGLERNPLSESIKLFNPRWDEKGNFDNSFNEAVSFVERIFARYLAKKTSEYKAEELLEPLVTEALESNTTYVVLDKFLPWQEFICRKTPTIKSVVFPSRGGWGVQLVPTAPGSFENRSKFREGVKTLEGIAFVHTAGFLAVAETKDVAIKIATEFVE